MSIDLEFAIKKDIRNNPIVREVDVQQKREFRQTLGIVTLVVAIILFWAWPHMQVVRRASQIEHLRQAVQAAEARNRHLRLELATVSAPQIVDERARRRLRLVTPTEKDTVIVERVQPARPAHAIVADAARSARR
jgi:cell division protein FtsB